MFNTNKISYYFILIFGLGLILSGCKYEPVIGKWKEGKIPYYLSGDFTNSDTAAIENAMQQWENVCGVKFYKVSPRARAYNIKRTNENSWSSSIGENNAVCYMDFGEGESPLPHIIHELGHTLGLLHEHQRPDRDLYVKIHFDRIISSYVHNFEIQNNPLIDESKYRYDYNSIMHYPPVSFSIDGLETITSLDPDNPVNRLDIITDIDAQKAREIYGKPLTSESNIVDSSKIEFKWEVISELE